MPLRTEKVSQTKLQDIAAMNGAIRAGATGHGQVDRRARDYSRDGYGGTMYYAPTKNMQHAENKLLDNQPRHNEQLKSNVQSGPGNTYVIVGRKYNN